MTEQLALFDKAPYYKPLRVFVRVDSFFSDYDLLLTDDLKELYEAARMSEEAEEEFLSQVIYYLADDIVGDMHVTDWEVKRVG